MKRLLLKHQLNASATSKAEAAQLAALAHTISHVELPRLSAGAKAAIARDIGFSYHPHRRAFVRSWEGVMAIFVVMILTFAQSARPGSALYSVKKGTDKVRTALIQNIPLLDRADDPLNHENGTKGDTPPRSSDGSTDGSSGKAGADSGSGTDTSGTRLTSDDTSGGSGTSGSGDSSNNSLQHPSSGSGSSKDSSGSDSAPSDSFNLNLTR